MFKSACFTIFILITTSFSFAQNADSTSSKHPGFYIEALAGVDYLYYVEQKNEPYKNSHIQLFRGLSNTNYLRRPPTFKLALNYRANRREELFIGVKYDHFVTHMQYNAGSFNYSVAYPQGENTEYDIISQTDNIQVFTGAKFNFKGFYFSASLNLNTLIMHETKKGYYNYFDSYNRIYKYESFDGTSSGVEQSCMGFSINTGYDFLINKKGQAIKLELEGDYIYRKVRIPQTRPYEMNIFNPSICIGYRF